MDSLGQEPSTNVAIDPATGKPYPKPTIVIGNIVLNSGNLTNCIFQTGHGVNRYLMESQAFYSDRASA